MSAVLVMLTLVAADISIVVTPTSSNVVVTITVPTSAAPTIAVATVATNAAVAPTSVPTTTTGKFIPMPPMPPLLARRTPIPTAAAHFLRPMPGATNYPSYERYLQTQAQRSALGRRRSE